MSEAPLFVSCHRSSQRWLTIHVIALLQREAREKGEARKGERAYVSTGNPRKGPPGTRRRIISDVFRVDLGR